MWKIETRIGCLVVDIMIAGLQCISCSSLKEKNEFQIWSSLPRKLVKRMNPFTRALHVWNSSSAQNGTFWVSIWNTQMRITEAEQEEEGVKNRFSRWLTPTINYIQLQEKFRYWIDSCKKLIQDFIHEFFWWNLQEELTFLHEYQEHFQWRDFFL